MNPSPSSAPASTSAVPTMVPPPPAGPALPTQDQVKAELREIYDPEIPVNIVDLGLIYEIGLDAAKRDVHVKMTMTSMGCPTLEEIRLGAETRIKAMDGVASCVVEVVWVPPWTPEMMTDEGKFHMQALGFNI